MKLYIPPEKRPFEWFAVPRLVGTLLYSLLYFGMHYPSVADAALIMLIPFLPLAYVVGAFTGSALPDNMIGYAVGGWLTVFLQAYIVATVISFAVWGAKRKR